MKLRAAWLPVRAALRGGLARLRSYLTTVLFEKETVTRPTQRKKRMLSAAVSLGVFTALNFLLSYSPLYRYLQNADLDRLANHSQRSVAASGHAPAAVVLIDQSGFERYFGSRSPLPPRPLLNVLHTLCALHPARLGVDIFSGQWLLGEGKDRMTQDELDRALAQLGTCPLVWIRDSRQIADVAGEPAFQLGRVLGQDAPTPGTCTALPVFFPDEDQVLRTQLRSVQAGVSSSDLRPYSTMAESLRHPASCGFSLSPAGAGSGDESTWIGFRDDANIVRLNFQDFFLDGPESQRPEFERSRQALAGSLGIGPGTVLILGAGFEEARDRYTTPLGQRYGAEILADAAIGDPVRRISTITGLELDTALSLVLLVVLNWWPLRFVWSAGFTFVLSLVVAVLQAWYFFILFGYFYSLLTAMAATAFALLGQLAFERLGKDRRAILADLRSRHRQAHRAAHTTPPGR